MQNRRFNSPFPLVAAVEAQFVAQASLILVKIRCAQKYILASRLPTLVFPGTLPIAIFKRINSLENDCLHVEKHASALL